MYYGHYFLGMDLIWWAIWLITLVLFFIRTSRKNNKSSPLDILQKRFSNGEINIHEYEQRKRFLEKDEDLKAKIFFLSRTYK